MPVRTRVRVALSVVVAAVMPLGTACASSPPAAGPGGLRAAHGRAGAAGTMTGNGQRGAGQRGTGVRLTAPGAGGAARWVATWAAAPMAATPESVAGPDDPAATGFADQTIRDIVWASAGGDAARVRLANTFGSRPVTFTRVFIGVSGRGARVRRGTSHRVTFGGRRSVTIRPGSEAVSDPVDMAVPAGTDLAVSMFTRKPTGPATYHSDAQQVNYVAAGDHAGSRSGAAFTGRTGHWYFLDGVDAAVGPRVGGTIVAIGDSITDGFRSAENADLRWPNDLARRTLAGTAGPVHPVIDEGIGGNRMLRSSPCFGPSAMARFQRDVAAQPGARYVILLEGVNDIGFSSGPPARPGPRHRDARHSERNPCLGPVSDPSAAQIVAGYQYLIEAAHNAGLKIFGATLTPFGGVSYYSQAAEATRQAVNHWIRTSGAFDGVIDFDRAVRDPADPLRLLPAYDSGDHLHPDDAGYQAMANAVDLALFRSGG